ncbi:MAG: hypothetical protein R3B13_02150 [Polyangiaceae bacterium]
MKSIALILFAALASAACSDDDAAPGGTCANCVGADSGSDAAADAASADATTDGAMDAGPDASDAPFDAAADCALLVQGLGVAESDLDGYPPYALAECRLAYVAKSGELRERDLESGVELSVAPASEKPRRPAMAQDVLAWEAEVAGKSVVRVRHSGVVTTLSGSFDHAREPRAAGNVVAFTAFFGATDDSDSDIFLYDAQTQSALNLSNAKAQQRFADVSATHVAWSDFAEDPAGTYAGDGTSLADIVLYDRGTQQSITLKQQGKQAFPMLGVGGRIGYLEWLEVHPVPKLQDYRIMSLPLQDLAAAPTLVAAVQSDVAVRPAAVGARVEWVVRSGGKSSLLRAPLDGSSVAQIVDLGGVAEVHAPAGTAALSVVATRSVANGTPSLRALAVP